MLHSDLADRENTAEAAEAPAIDSRALEGIYCRTGSRELYARRLNQRAGRTKAVAEPTGGGGPVL